MSKDGPILSVRNLAVHFPIRRGVFQRVVGYVRAVDGVSFSIPTGRTLGLVGESGCGKTTVARGLLRLIPPSAGEVHFEGRRLSGMNRSEMRGLRQEMQIIFQDPVGSLNPRMTVGSIVGEPLAIHSGAPRWERRNRVAEVLERVGLSADYMGRYPHEFSGGQRQRIGIARALALKPKLILCDEPVSALDVSIQSQILNLLGDLQEDYGISYLFIAHNLAVIEHFSDNVAVMYLGRIVEYASAEALYARPRHPYTRALLAAAPEPDPTRPIARMVLPGEVPSPIDPPRGCPFHPRCPLTRELGNGQVLPKCEQQCPTLESVDGNEDHLSACWFTPP